MSSDQELAAARLRAEQARLRLLAAAHELQARIAPKRVVNDAVETAKERGQVLMERARDIALRRPGAVSAALLGLVALAARRRIIGLFRRQPDRITIPASRVRALPRPKGDKA